MLPYSTVEQLRYGHVTNQDYFFRTGIEKKPTDKVSVTALGFVGDEQAEIFHGGIERAVLQFDCHYYAQLQQLFPASASLFVCGGYGENLVVAGMNEHNICIGDKIAVGSVMLEVAQPRQPCFKLNHRFKEPTISRYSQDNSKTGWFYRVLQEGDINVNDEIRVIERPYPQWTIATVQHYLYIETDNLAATTALAQLPELGAEVRGVFQHRLESNEVEDWNSRLESLIKLEMRVVKIVVESATIKRFYLSRTDLGALPSFSAGAYITLKLPNGLKRSYSLCDSAVEGVYQIAVQQARDSQGGSQYMHQQVNVGDVLSVYEPANFFEMARDKHQLFVAAGIGITPFIAMIHEAIAHQEQFELHYCVDNIDDYPFKRELSAYAANIHLYTSAQRLDLAQLLNTHQRGSHVYSCGSPAFVQLVRDNASHWSSKNVHFENFSPVEYVDDSAFSAIITHSGAKVEINVTAKQSVLDAIRKQGLTLDSACETGTCGRCKVKYSGDVDHRDTILSARERKTYMTPCVSRCKSGVLNIQLD
ncbi:MOSC domain-containing protein [Photobacterium kishitanii]|uniref:MOSC domain-containing protein n=1 Tax=Photobacterium kishitanii TaxID=318456 RepID=UPI0005E927AE|nr:MOSC domain-containing protein [Photobacterium kishitanii]KJG08361.1 phthalate 4,5-dioxygenase [Photobacterium kishitanii]PSV02162.1 MOSC domain-containing protein [Photobacterium kishitanii]PSV72315.1 MOSC domain-containing protein [Photobacterium kishitanii]